MDIWISNIELMFYFFKYIPVNKGCQDKNRLRNLQVMVRKGLGDSIPFGIGDFHKLFLQT